MHTTTDPIVEPRSLPDARLIQKLKFETIWEKQDTGPNGFKRGVYFHRAKVIGGWLVHHSYSQVDGRPTPSGSSEPAGTGIGASVTFVPDPNHAWNLDDYLT